MDTPLPFRTSFEVCWGDLDSNGHMRNTAYLDYSAQTRFRCLAAYGFGPSQFREAGIGPAVFEDHLAYRRELRLLERFTVELFLAGESANGAKFILLNRFALEDGTLCAEVRTFGAWFNIGMRKVVEPPPGLKEALGQFARTEYFDTSPQWARK